MKKLTLLAAILLAAAFHAGAQELTVKSFQLKINDMTAKIDPVLDLNGEPCALIKVAVAAPEISFSGNIINAPVFQSGEWYVYVPAKTRRIKISVLGCLPLTYEFPETIEQNRTYELVLKMPELKKDKYRSIVLPTFSMGKADMSYGIMVGFVKKAGAFVRFKSDFAQKFSTEYVCDADGYLNSSGTKPWYDGSVKKSRWAVTGGYVQRVAKPFYLYVGAGYGQRLLAWGLAAEDNVNALVEPVSFTGYEVEAGAILRIGGFAVSAGVQTNQFKYMDANISVGIMF